MTCTIDCWIVQVFWLWRCAQERKQLPVSQTIPIHCPLTISVLRCGFDCNVLSQFQWARMAAVTAAGAAASAGANVPTMGDITLEHVPLGVV